MSTKHRPSIIHIQTDNLESTSLSNDHAPLPSKSPSSTPKVARRLVLSPLSANTLNTRKPVWFSNEEEEDHHNNDDTDNDRATNMKEEGHSNTNSNSKNMKRKEPAGKNQGKRKRNRRNVMSLSPFQPLKASSSIETEKEDDVKDLEFSDKFVSGGNKSPGLGTDQMNHVESQPFTNQDLSPILPQSSPTYPTNTVNMNMEVDVDVNVDAGGRFSNDGSEKVVALEKGIQNLSTSHASAKSKSKDKSVVSKSASRSTSQSLVSTSSSLWHLPQIPQTKYTTIRQAYKTRIAEIPTPKSITSTTNFDYFLNEGNQAKLTTSGSNLLSLDEVIIPGICQDQMAFLKRLEGKAKGRKQVDVVGRIKLCRAFLVAVERNATQEILMVRHVHQEQKKQERLEAKQKAKEQAKLEKKQAKEERRRERQEERKRREKQQSRLRVKKEARRLKLKERRKKELKKQLPRNQELWREVALLMTDLAKLEKEEKMWKESNVLLEQKEKEMEARYQEDMKTLESLEKDVDKEALNSDQIYQQLDSACFQVIDKTLHATNKICDALEELSSCVDASDAVRQKVYTAYKKDHQLHGYFGATDPKALIRAIGLGI